MAGKLTSIMLNRVSLAPKSHCQAMHVITAAAGAAVLLLQIHLNSRWEHTTTHSIDTCDKLTTGLAVVLYMHGSLLRAASANRTHHVSRSQVAVAWRGDV